MGELREQSNRVVKYYRKTAEEYDRQYDTPFWKELYDRITWHYIEPYLPTAGLVLDAGGGTGKWALPIAEKGLNVVVYDLSREMLSVALAKANARNLEKRVQVKTGDICTIDFPDDHFDFVLAEGDPISYCSDPDKAVGELSRVLKPHGYISAGVDSLFSLVRRLLTLNQDVDGAMQLLTEKRFYSEEAGFSFWVFTPKELKQLFQKYGLTVVKTVGKPVVASRQMEPILQNPEKTKRLLEVELTLCEEESMVGCGGHLHIVARKS